MIHPLDLIFMGTPDFAATILTGLIDAGHRVRVVYTQPPRPAGRGHRVHSSPVGALAEQRRIEVRCPTTLRDPEAQAEFAAIPADAAVVAAYGLILPAAILPAQRLGCLNVHASLLPRWRGAAPIQRALLAGDSETGITIMQMNEGLDTGPILLQEAIPIAPKVTSGELSERLAALGARLILDALDGVAQGTLVARPQPITGVTYAAKLRREEARLDWRLPQSGSNARCAPSIRGPAPISAAAANASACCWPMWTRDPSPRRRARCSTSSCRSPAARGCCDRCGCSGPAAARSTRRPFCAGLR